MPPFVSHASESQANEDTWTASDIGATLMPGSTSYDAASEQFTLSGSGADIWGRKDAFQFARTELSGDGQIRARLLSLVWPHNWTKAGLMLRADESEESVHAMLVDTGAHGLRLQYRAAKGGFSFDRSLAAGQSRALPLGIRVQRTGNLLTAWTEVQGRWKIQDTLRLDLGEEIFAGLALTSHLDSALATAVFDQVEVGHFGDEVPDPTTRPEGWQNSDLGEPLKPGLLHSEDGRMLLVGAGKDIWAQSDEGHFVWRELPAAGTAIATVQIDSFQAGDPWAKVGIMVRESPAADSRHCFLALTIGNGLAWQERANTGGQSAHTALGAMNGPTWLRVEINGQGVVTGSTSPDGLVWTPRTTRHFVTSQGPLIGFAISSHATNAVASAELMTPSLILVPDPLDASYDGDGNGLPDAWELRHFGTTGIDPNADADGDGLSNRQEYEFGTSPVAWSSREDGLQDGRGLPGMVLFERWTDREIVGLNISDFRRFGKYPHEPTVSTLLPSLEIPPASQPRWTGSRMRAWIAPPENGFYHFFVTGEYRVELFLSPDETSWKKTRRCYVDGWAAYGDWFYKNHLKSAAVELEAGKKYYIEVLAKSEGQRNLAQVGWTTPGQTVPVPIPSEHLIAFGAEDDADDDLLPDDWERLHFGGLHAQPHEDPDQDGLTNAQEFASGLNPMAAHSSSDGLPDLEATPGYALYDVWFDQKDVSAQDFVASAHYESAPDFRTLLTASTEPTILQNHYVGILRGLLVPTVSGTHQFELRNARDSFALYLATQSNSADPANKELLTTKNDHKISRHLVAGQAYYFELVRRVGTQPHAAQLLWKKPDSSTFTAIEASALSTLPLPSPLPPQAAPAPWQVGDIAVNRSWTAYAGRSVFDENGEVFLRVAGLSARQHSDDLYFVGQELEGDGVFSARFIDFGSYPSSATAGIMLRTDRSPGAANVRIVTNPAGSLSFGWRNGRDDRTITSAAVTRDGSLWMRLVRSQGWIYAYTSQDGNFWNWLGEQQVPLHGPVLAGVFGASGSNTRFAEMRFDSLSLQKDTDGDGIPDDEDAGASVDSDGDGYSDYEEIHFLHSNPGVADLAAALEVDTMAGTDATPALGFWGTDTNGIHNLGVRGAVDFTISVPEAGIYRLAITGGPRSNSTADSIWNVLVTMGTQEIATIRYDLALGESGTAFAYTPWLAAGTHTVRLFLDNVSIYRSFTFQSLTVHSIGGVDANANGTPDWQEARFAAQNRLKQQAPASVTSPYCLEGESRYFDHLKVAAADTQIVVQRGVGDGWYAEVPLNPAVPTEVAISFENRTATPELKTLTWTPTNVLSTPTAPLVIRKGDSLLLQAAPLGETTGNANVEVTQGGAILATYALAGRETQPHRFDQAGTFLISGSYVLGSNAPLVGSLTVVVKEAAFADPHPVLALGYSREWLNPNLPVDAIIEADKRMEVVELPPPLAGGRNFRLRADAAAPRYMLARLNDGTESGPILDRAEIKTVRASSGAQTGIYFVDEFEDGSQLVEMRVVLSAVPEDLRLKFEIFVAGVVFEDGSTVKWFTAADFNDLGELRVRFLRGPGVTSSACHRLYIHQGQTLLETRTN